MGYNLYRGNQSGGPYNLLNSSLVTGTASTDASVQAGHSYYYVATAVNSNQVESAYSNEAQVFVPYPVVSSQLSITPASVTFGTFYLGSSSSQTVTLTDTGSASVVVSGETVTGTGFSTSGLSIPLTLAGGQSASFTVTFAPAAAGSATGSVSVVSNASNSPSSLPLTGTGAVSSHSVAISWNASTSSVAGYNAYRGNQSGGPYTKLNSALVATNPYTDSAVEAGQTYFYVVTAVNSSGVESPYSNEAQATVPSSSQLSVSPISVNFGSIAVGSSAPQTATLTNSGPDTLTVSQANVTGTGFSISGLSLPLTMAAGQSGTFTVAFTPTVAGSATGSLSVVSNASDSPTAVSLSGTGIRAIPNRLSFGKPPGG
jgi:fibronectin type 3 domain-containing protein